MENVQHISVLHEIKQPNFDKHNLQNCLLLVFIGRDQLNYAIQDSNNGAIVFLKSYKIPLQSHFFNYKLLISDLFESEVLFDNDFKEVRIALNSAKCTLMPAPLFDEAALSIYFNFNHKANEGNELLYDYIGNNDIINIYAADDYLLSAFEVPFDKYTLYHSSSVLLNHLLKNSTNQNTGLHLHLQDEFIDLIYLKNGKLHIHNIYQYQSSFDVLFYTLNLCKHQAINWKDTPCYLFGDLSTKQTTHQLLQKYFSDLQLASSPLMTNIPISTEAHPSFFTLCCLA